MGDPPIGGVGRMRLTVDAALASANCGLAGHPLLVATDSDGLPYQVKCRCGHRAWQVPAAAELARLRESARILSDLDRCEHGRHRIDSCLSCPGGWSAGNPHMPGPGNQVGVDRVGEPYFMPSGDRGDERCSTGDPHAWRAPLRPAPARTWKPPETP